MGVDDGPCQGIGLGAQAPVRKGVPASFGDQKRSRAGGDQNGAEEEPADAFARLHRHWLLLMNASSTHRAQAGGGQAGQTQNQWNRADAQADRRQHKLR